MSSSTPAVERLRRVDSLPYGPARTAATELITREIEEHGPREILPEALLSLVAAHTFSGGEDLAFAPFARALRLWDEAPELFDEQDTSTLFWSFKWVAAATCSFPQISRAQAEALLANMERRYRLAGYSVAAVEKIRLQWRLHTGEEPREVLQRWLTATRDGSTDCAACDISAHARVLGALGELDEAARIAHEQDGRCNREPAGTFYDLAGIELRRGDANAARAALRQARREEKREDVDGCAEWRGRDFEVLARTGDLDLALRRLAATSPAAGLSGEDPLDTLDLLRSVCAGLSANPERLGDAAPSLPGVAGASTLGSLLELVRDRATELADQFDRRNGTQHQSALLAEALAATFVPGATDEPDPEPEVFSEKGPQQLWEHAESLAADDPARVAAYLAAARAAEDAGMLDDAGLAYSEHAQAAVLAEQEADAHRAFERGVRLLNAGEAPGGVIAQVLSAWAPIAVLANDLSAILEILGGRLDQATAPLERARLADSLARLIASAPDQAAQQGLDLTAAMSLAEEAAGKFEETGSLSLAAHAGWLLARLQRDAGLSAEATATYRIVLAAFASLREQGHRTEAAGELIAHLRGLGETLAADEVARELGERLR